MPQIEDSTSPTILDAYRGMAAQKQTDERRNLSEVQADQMALRQEQAEMEKYLFAAPAATWEEAAARAEHLLKLLAAIPGAQDPRYGRLIKYVFDDFRRLRDPTTA